MRTFLLFTTIGLLALAAVPSAMADTVTYSLTSDHCTGLCLVSPDTSFGTITLTDGAAGTVLVSVSLNAHYQFTSTGKNEATIGWNSNIIPDPTISASGVNISIDGTKWTLLNGGVPGVNGGVPDLIHEDGTGDFEYGLDCTVCQGSNSNVVGPVTFNVTASGLTAASFAQVSSGAQYFAVDVLSSNGNTGFVDASSPGDVTLSTGGGEVPEPASVVLLGSLLVGISAITRKKLQRSA